MTKKNNYKVLVIPAWFDHKNKTDGLFIHQFCEAMQNEGQEISILYLQTFSLRHFWKYFKPIRFSYSNNFNVINLKKFIVPSLNKNNKFSFFKKNLAKKAISSVAGKNFDIIHIQSVCNNLTPYLASEISKALKIPYVITEHYSSFKEAGEAIFVPYGSVSETKNIIETASYRMGVSNYACKKFEDFFECNFQAFPNIINESFFNKPLPAETKKTSHFRFLIIAALEEHKGQSLLIKAFKQVFSDNKNTTLTLVGKGSNELQLKKLVTELNLQEQVIFTGALSTDQTINEIDNSHVIVSASFYETFGLTVVESFLRGNPVLSTRSGGPDELINELNGILCNVNDLNDLAKGLKQIHESYSQFNKSKIREEAMNKFSTKKLVKDLTEIYDDVLHRKAQLN